jgi:hypothetical protein
MPPDVQVEMCNDGISTLGRKTSVIFPNHVRRRVRRGRASGTPLLQHLSKFFLSTSQPRVGRVCARCSVSRANRAACFDGCGVGRQPVFAQVGLLLSWPAVANALCCGKRLERLFHGHQDRRIDLGQGAACRDSEYEA